MLLSAKLHVGLAELAVEEKEREPVIIASTEEPSVWTVERDIQARLSRSKRQSADLRKADTRAQDKGVI